MGTLNELRDEAYRIAREHGFTDATPGEDIALMHSELSEALEEIRLFEKGYYSRINAEAGGKPTGVAIELADCVIRIAHFCGKHGIDLDRAVETKMKYNESRPFKHGGKKL